MNEKLRLQEPDRPFVRTGSDHVSMHFNALDLQSLMCISRPNDLEVPYTKTMMGFLLVNPHPKHILMVGLGGGSLAKYCYHHLPNTKITVVEINPHVIHLRDHFAIPQDDARFKVICMDAAEYVREAKQEFDAVLLDGFDADGQVATLCSRHFYENCMRVMSVDGVMATNLDGGHPAHTVFVGRLRQVFADSLMEVSVPMRDNRVVFVTKGRPMKPIYLSLSGSLGHHPEEVRNHLKREFQSILVQMDAIAANQPTFGEKMA